MISRLVLLGASGDLARRWLLPALDQLIEAGALPADLRVLGGGLEPRIEALPGLGAVAERFEYTALDVGDPAALGALLERATGPERGPVAVYLALPIELAPGVVDAVAAAALPTGSRLALEKPFGRDAASAAELNRRLEPIAARLGEDAVYRVDHALAMSALHHLLALRTAEPLSALWSDRHIARIEVLWEETIAPLGRAAYFDRAGLLRDVMQNHLLQLLCVAIAQAPPGTGFAEVRERRIEVLRAARLVSGADGVPVSRRARYTAGRLADSAGADGRLVPAYADEPGVDPARETETLAEVWLAIESPRWRNTEMRLFAAKALAAGRKGVLVHFRPGAGAGDPERGEQRFFDVEAFGSERAPYGRVLAELLDGGRTLSVTAEEPVAAWRLLDPVLAAWRAGLVPLEEYPAGSPAPAT